MRPHAALVLCLALFVLTARAHAAGATYRFDPVHSQITFFVDHDGYSDASGRLHIARGWFRFDPDDWSTAKVVADIDLGGVDMGDRDWNRVVAGDDFLDAKAHPYAHFVSGEVEKTGAETGILFGRLTLRGHTVGIAFPFRFNRRAFTIYGLHTVAGFTGLATLERKDFGMDAFAGVIGPQVKVLLEIEGIEDSGAEHTYADQVARETAHADQK
ncbi:MAG: YceI family protein [Xanthomonadaceae bacterium]|nr:YceI family protein [Xanthomonadaceae bacterium]